MENLVLAVLPYSPSTSLSFLSSLNYLLTEYFISPDWLNLASPLVVPACHLS